MLKVFLGNFICQLRAHFNYVPYAGQLIKIYCFY